MPGIIECLSVHPPHVGKESRTGKSLLDIHHLSGTRLHKSTIPRPRPLQPVPARYHACILQIALVARHDFDRLDFLRVVAVLTFHIDHLHKVIQRGERRLIGDVVDEEECIGAEVRCRPQAAVFFLTGSIGEGEKVRLAIDGSGDGI